MLKQDNYRMEKIKMQFSFLELKKKSETLSLILLKKKTSPDFWLGQRLLALEPRR